MAKLDLVGTFNEGAGIAGGLESPLLFARDHGSSTKESRGAKATSGSSSDVLTDHCDVLTRMPDVDGEGMVVIGRCVIDSVEERTEIANSPQEENRETTDRLNSLGSSLAMLSH